MEIPFIRDTKVEYGACERLSPLVRRVVCNNPNPFTFTGTGTFIIGNGTVAIIDPGPLNEAHLDSIMAALQPSEIVSHILVTHTHADHSPLAVPLKERTHALVCGALRPPKNKKQKMEAVNLDEGISLEEAIDQSFKPDIVLQDNDELTGADWTLQALYTPGHISDHMCYALKEEKTLFTGDHVMGWATSVIAPPDGNMRDYMAALHRLLARDDVLYRPTHGAAIENPQVFVRAYIAHREARQAQILEQLEKGATQIADIVAVLYADIDVRLHPAASLSVLAHIQALIEDGIVVCDSGTSDGTANLHANYNLTGTKSS
ncbi:MAG: MBL fold metallo-hydrolase [Alphaproteobacteria bacterium]|nr:MBL fold metallo-hydrolase [Alphaproteobacteria bacterium]